MISVLHPAAIPEEWLNDDGWIVGINNWCVDPLDEHCEALERDAYDLRWHVHELSSDQLTEIGMDEARPFVLRWGEDADTDEGRYPRRGILCTGATLEEVAEEANAYLQMIVDEWIADEPARRERIKARCRAWLEAHGEL